MKEIIPQNFTNKYERINTIAFLLCNSPHTITELATKLNVSTKTIQRDLYDELSKYGAKRTGRKWSMQPSQTNDNLNSEDKTIINILDNISKSMGANFYSKAHVLLEQITNQLNHPILTNANIEKLNEDDLIKFHTLKDAIKQKKIITCKYNNYNFKVKPLKLAMFDGFWYLLFLDTNKSDLFKKFHLKSIGDIALSDESFEISDELETRIKAINSAWANLNKPKTARLLLAPEVVKYFERKPLTTQSITGKDNDGSVEIEINYTHIMEIKPLIYYYLPYIKVLSPKELVDVVRGELKEYNEQIK